MGCSEDVEPLPQFILLLPNYLILNEEEGEERSDEIVKCTYGCHDVIIIDVFVFADGILGVAVVNLLDSVFNMRVFDVAENRVVDK